MRERREGITDQRAQKLEETISKTLKLADIDETPDQIMARYVLDLAQSETGNIKQMSPHESFLLYMEGHGIDNAAQIQVLLMMGELYGAGDDTVLDSHIERLEDLREQFLNSPED